MLLRQILLCEALKCTAPSAYTQAVSPSHHTISAYGIIRSAITELLADELVHPVLLLIVGTAGAHEARDDEGHGGFEGGYVCCRIGFSILMFED